MIQKIAEILFKMAFYLYHAPLHDSSVVCHVVLMTLGQMPPLYLTDWFPNKQPEVRGLFSYPTNLLLNLGLIIIFMAKTTGQITENELKQVD